MITLILCKEQDLGTGTGMGSGAEYEQKQGDQAEAAVVVWVSHGGGWKRGAGCS